MSASGVASPMAKKRDESLTRISPKALAAARVACAFNGMPLVEYLSMVVQAAADRDIDEAYAERNKPKEPEKPKRAKK